MEIGITFWEAIVLIAIYLFLQQFFNRYFWYVYQLKLSKLEAEKANELMNNLNTHNKNTLVNLKAVQDKVKNIDNKCKDIKKKEGVNYFG